MNCADAQALLQDFVDGRLPDDQAQAVRAHVEACDACAREVALYRQVDAALASAPAPPIDLADAVMARVAAIKPARAAAWRAWAYAAACAVVCGALWALMPAALRPAALYDQAAASVRDQFVGFSVAVGETSSQAAARLSAAFEAAAHAAEPDAMADALGRVAWPSIPLALVIAALVFAVSVDVYCLRRGAPQAQT